MKTAYRILITLLLSACICAVQANDDLEKGRAIAFDRSKGNCLACHIMEAGESPGNIGPELNDMRTRYPDPAVLRARIWNEAAFNPLTVMPPFGKHGILSEEEVDLVLHFVLSL